VITSEDVDRPALESVPPSGPNARLMAILAPLEPLEAKDAMSPIEDEPAEAVD
jgi:hypothetical protein